MKIADLRLVVMTYQSFNTDRLDERETEIANVFAAMREAPDSSVKFKVDADTKRKGFKVKPVTISVPVEGSDTPATKSGLALVEAGSIVLFVR